MTQVEWFVKDRNDYYYELNTYDLEQPYFDKLHGVYVVWYFDRSSLVIVYAGRGMIKKRLKAHRRDKRIQKHASNNTLYVAWAEIRKRY